MALHGSLAGIAGRRPFTGHIGGDDFIVVCTPEQVGPITERAIARFAETSPALYDPADVERGYFEVLDRQGRSHRHGPLTVSIGVALSTQRTFTDHREVVAVASEMKQVAKRSPGSVVAVDRRREREPGRGPAARSRAWEAAQVDGGNGRAHRRAAEAAAQSEVQAEDRADHADRADHVSGAGHASPPGKADHASEPGHTSPPERADHASKPSHASPAVPAGAGSPTPLESPRRASSSIETGHRGTSRRVGGAHAADPQPAAWTSDPDRTPATPAWEP
jgi:hypothetical protein